MFREVPCILRPVIYYKGTYFDGEQTDDINAILDWFPSLHYLKNITNFNSKKSSFICLSNDVTHANINISTLGLISNATLSYPDSEAYDINAVCLKYLSDWCNYLKQNNAWNNTKIIIKIRLIRNVLIGKPLLSSSSVYIYYSPFKL